MVNELKVLEGVDVIALARKHSDQATMSGQILPWQTSLSFDPSVDTDSTVTKDGNVATRSNPTTDLETEFLNNTSAIADAMYDSLFDNELLDFWVLYRNRRNNEGKYFAWYMQVLVSEDSSDNDPDDHSTRDVSFSVNGKPKRGWTALDSETQQAVDYIFHGVGKVTDEDKTGGGTEWDKNNDPGTNVESPKADTPVAVTGVTLTPATATVQVGKTTQLTAKVSPDDAAKKDVTFSTKDEQIAKVDTHGLVTGVAAGSTDITVTTADGAKTAKATITVEAVE